MSHHLPKAPARSKPSSFANSGRSDSLSLLVRDSSDDTKRQHEVMKTKVAASASQMMSVSDHNRKPPRSGSGVVGSRSISVSDHNPRRSFRISRSRAGSLVEGSTSLSKLGDSNHSSTSSSSERPHCISGSSRGNPTSIQQQQQDSSNSNLFDASFGSFSIQEWADDSSNLQRGDGSTNGFCHDWNHKEEVDKEQKVVGRGHNSNNYSSQHQSNKAKGRARSQTQQHSRSNRHLRQKAEDDDEADDDACFPAEYYRSSSNGGIPPAVEKDNVPINATSSSSSPPEKTTLLDYIRRQRLNGCLSDSNECKKNEQEEEQKSVFFPVDFDDDDTNNKQQSVKRQSRLSVADIKKADWKDWDSMMDDENNNKRTVSSTPITIPLMRDDEGINGAVDHNKSATATDTVYNAVGAIVNVGAQFGTTILGAAKTMKQNVFLDSHQHSISNNDIAKSMNQKIVLIKDKNVDRARYRNSSSNHHTIIMMDLENNEKLHNQPGCSAYKAVALNSSNCRDARIMGR